MTRFIRAAAVWLFTAIYWPVLLPFCFLGGRVLRGAGIHHLAHFWGKTALRIAGIRLVIEYEQGEYPFRETAPRVAICNHPSALEVLWGAAVSPPRPFVIGKKELMYIPIINLVWWSMGFALVDRKNGAKAIRGLRGVSSKIVEQSRTLLIAPEGTRSSTGNIGSFKKGAFHLAIASQAPIYPIVVYGSFELMPRHAWLTKSGTIWLRFLAPIPTQGKDSSSIDELISLARARMLQVHSELKTKASL